ncbi:hypothetical protein DS891_23840 [Pseudoalteromonas sp. JC28]|uniref:hypothetical protein n=1 Tax=Pseudoalteromonas sp. JC28 TaxID=2267617 RepID=UPI001572F223|nr:hypothetical protein [Pseudoalteromonas sp. JC28]NSY36521.1 hypothetical protein [Pseudoalteromonas sp. JC28]
MSTSQSFSIFYRSKETENHTIDAESLGQSLISFAKALKMADIAINGPNSELEIDVKAHKPGSFGVEFEIVHLLENAKDILQYLGIVTTSGTITGGSLIALLKKVNGRKITGTVRKQGADSIIQLDDGSEIKCDATLEELATNPEFRKHYEDVFYNPVKNDPTATVCIEDAESKVVENLELKTLESFKKIDGRSVETKTEEFVKNIRFTQVNFDSGAKGWRAELPNHENDVAVKLADESFFSTIDKSETSLVKGSLFEVKLEVKTFFKVNQSPTYRYTILKVIRHRTSKEQKLI